MCYACEKPVRTVNHTLLDKPLCTECHEDMMTQLDRLDEALEYCEIKRIKDLDNG